MHDPHHASHAELLYIVYVDFNLMFQWATDDSKLIYINETFLFYVFILFYTLTIKITIPLMGRMCVLEKGLYWRNIGRNSLGT